MGAMEIEDRGGREWLVCPNGCATECEAPPRKPPASEEEPAQHANAAGQ
jgi:hypothetical protein